MIRLLILGRRAAGITREAAHRHMRLAHGRLVLCQPEDAGAPVAGYTQNHVVDGVYFAAAGDYAVERDLLTEICFDSLDHMRAGLASDYHASVLHPDEANFVDDAGAAKMMVETRRVVPGDRARWTLFVLVGCTGEDEAARRSAAVAIADGLAGAPGIAALAEHRVLPSPAGAPFVDWILEAGFDTREAATLALSVAAALVRERGAIDRARSLILVAERYDADRLRALYR